MVNSSMREFREALLKLHAQPLRTLDRRLLSCELDASLRDQYAAVCSQLLLLESLVTTAIPFTTTELRRLMQQELAGLVDSWQAAKLSTPRVVLNDEHASLREQLRGRISSTFTHQEPALAELCAKFRDLIFQLHQLGSQLEHAPLAEFQDELQLLFSELTTTWQSAVLAVPVVGQPTTELQRTETVLTESNIPQPIVENHMSFASELQRLKAEGKGQSDPAVLALIEKIKAEDPALLGYAESLFKEPATGLALLSWLPKNMNADVGVGVAGTLAIIATTSYPKLLGYLTNNYPLDSVDEKYVLPIIAGLGALAGIGYSLYCNKALVLPIFTSKNGELTLTRWGVLNELWYGLWAAVMTIGLTAAGLSPLVATETPPADSPPPATAGTGGTAGTGAAGTKQPERLSYAVLLSSLVAGWLGARMRAGYLDRSLLQDALSRSASMKPQSVTVSNEIRTATSAKIAAEMATGLEVVNGFRPQFAMSPPAVVASSQSIPAQSREATLFQFLDEGSCRAASNIKGKLRRDGQWLELRMLRSQGIDPHLLQAIGSQSLVEVAAKSETDLLSGVTQPEQIEQLKSVQRRATIVRSMLDEFPADWAWPA